MPNESDGTKGRGIFQRIDHLLFKPHQEIKGSRMRQQAQYLSILLLVAVPVFAFAQLVSDLTINLTYLAISMSYLACYFLSRTRFYHITSGITVIASSLLPIALFVLGSDWVPYDLPRILVWVTLSILMGALFIRPRYVILQFTIISLVLLYFSLLHFAMPWYDIAEFFATEFLIAVLIIISAVMVHNYADRTQVQTADLEKRRWELEVYSQLLRHDIRNDLQMLLGSVELAEMLCNINSGDTQRQLSTSLKIGQSIVSLLNAFSVFPEDVGLSFVRFLEKLSLQAKEGYENLEITIKSTARARQLDCARSRLMPMVWMNIFRNAAQHAGPEPKVLVSIEVQEDSFYITVADNGPGICDEDAKWLFVRGNREGQENRGLGLYLAKTIIESHGGTIELIDNVGCKIGVRLPLQLQV